MHAPADISHAYQTPVYGDTETVWAAEEHATYCAQDAEEQVQGGAEERIAKVAEAATRSSAAALLKKQQQHIPVKEDYFLPDDELGSGERQLAAYLSTYRSHISTIRDRHCTVEAVLCCAPNVVASACLSHVLRGLLSQWDLGFLCINRMGCVWQHGCCQPDEATVHEHA